MMAKKKFELKRVASPLANNIQFYLPLIEEITNAGMMPMCIIGIKQKEGEEKKIDTHFATHNKTMDAMLYDICKAFVVGYEQGNIKPI